MKRLPWISATSHSQKTHRLQKYKQQKWIYSSWLEMNFKLIILLWCVKFIKNLQIPQIMHICKFNSYSWFWSVFKTLSLHIIQFKVTMHDLCLIYMQSDEIKGLKTPELHATTPAKLHFSLESDFQWTKILVTFRTI